MDDDEYDEMDGGGKYLDNKRKYLELKKISPKLLLNWNWNWN
jgi:hypothetical protein